MTGLPLSPATQDEQFAWYREHAAGPKVWHNLCLSAVRQAAQLPAVAPSAHAAAVMTPPAQRVTRVRDLRRSMAVYWADFNDDNPADHITTVAGWRTPEPTDDVDDLLTWTTDVPGGGMSLVRGSYFKREWGDPFWMGARSLNGFYLPTFGPPEPAPDPAHIGPQLDIAITAVRQSLRYHRAHHHLRRVAALAQDLAELKETRAEFPKA